MYDSLGKQQSANVRREKKVGHVTLLGMPRTCRMSEKWQEVRLGCAETELHLHSLLVLPRERQGTRRAPSFLHWVPSITGPTSAGLHWAPGKDREEEFQSNEPTLPLVSKDLLGAKFPRKANRISGKPQGAGSGASVGKASKSGGQLVVQKTDTQNRKQLNCSVEEEERRKEHGSHINPSFPGLPRNRKPALCGQSFRISLRAVRGCEAGK